MGNKRGSVLNLRRILAILILGSVVVLTGVLWRYLQQQPPAEILDALPKQVDLSLDKLHYTQNEEGERSWTLIADKAEYQRDNAQALLEKVRLTFYRAGQFGKVTLNAGHGRLLQDQQQIEVWDQVEVRTDSGEQLYTERLRYDGQQRRLSTTEPIRLLTPQMELTGRGLQVDLEQGRMLVKEDVRGVLLPAQKERTTHD